MSNEEKAQHIVEIENLKVNISLKMAVGFVLVIATIIGSTVMQWSALKTNVDKNSDNIANIKELQRQHDSRIRTIEAYVFSPPTNPKIYPSQSITSK